MSAFPDIKIVDTIRNPDELILTKTLLKDRFKIGVNNMVKAAKDISNSQWAAPILLAALLGYNVYSGRTQSMVLTDLQRDLTILKTQKEDAEKYHDKEMLEVRTQLGEAENWRKNLENKINEIRYNQQQLIKPKEN